MYEINLDWESLKNIQIKTLQPIYRFTDNSGNGRVYLTHDSFTFISLLNNEIDIEDFENNFELSSLVSERYAIENDPNNFVGRNAGEDRLALALRFKSDIVFTKTFINILGGSGSSNSNNNKVYKIIVNPTFPSQQPNNWVDVGNGSSLQYAVEINNNEPQISGGRLLCSAIGQDTNQAKQPIILNTNYKMKFNDIVVFSIRPISNTQVNVRLEWEETK